MPSPPEAEVLTPALTIPGAFAEQVLRHGGRPAVVDGDTVLTYQELDERTRRVASALRGRGVPTGPVAAVLAAHGADLIVAMLAALRAGMAVVVLDPADPPERLRELLAESGAVVLLVDAAHAPRATELDVPAARVVRLDEALAAVPGPGTVVGGGPLPGDTAFVLFTSGSTGKPKGVVATHANMVLNVRNYALSAGLQPEDRLILLARPQFMAGLSAVFGALLNGAAVLPFDVRARGFRDLRDWLINERITLYHSVPTLFRRFCESLAPDVRFPSIRIVKLGGEPVMKHDVKLWRRHSSASSTLINGLGLSEANGNLCHFKIGHGDVLDDDVVPVGRPLPGVEIVLLDDAGALVPTGGTGEIAFRCPHRSPGYWRSDDFAARLVGLPSLGGGEPFFRSGDLGRFRPDGCLLHLGRKDDLIKLRGLRIEPAQVEAALLEDARIRHCAVGVRGEGSRPQQLVAWLVPSSDAAPSADDLRATLARRLPPALIPSSFVTLAELPMTPGGKVDRKALPDPRPTAAGSGEAPRDAVELALTRMWQKLLRVRRVGPHDDFFALGGDSLMAAVLLSQVEKSFRADLDLGAFMAAPTARGLAALVRSASADPIHQSLVLTRRGGPGTPYFFVPGAGAAGRPHSFEAEAGPRAHYRLNYRGLDGIEVPQRTVSEMAAYFLEQVRAAQPAGPYLLGGGSFGALVALEAAHRLVDEGESVNLLVVEDSLLDGCLVPRTGGRWSDWLERSLLWVLPVGKRFELTWPGVREGLRQWRYRLLVPLARWRSRLRGKPLPKVYRFHDLLNQSLRAKRRHVLRAYPGPVVLLRTRFTAARRLFELEPTLGWNRICPRLLTLELDGEKGDHITQPAPRAAYLERLDALLNAADDGRANGSKEEPAHSQPT